MPWANNSTAWKLNWPTGELPPDHLSPIGQDLTTDDAASDAAIAMRGINGGRATTARLQNEVDSDSTDGPAGRNYLYKNPTIGLRLDMLRYNSTTGHLPRP